MKVARTLSELAASLTALRIAGGSVGLVPTMGALHDGHAALLAAARRDSGAVVLSIFVNPLQFAPTEDLARYPRDEAGDLARAEASGCDIAWLPDVATLYPAGEATVIEVAGPALGFEGALRPGHFRGVATVCAKLFGHVRPDRAYFGEKDWQQLQVVRRMVADLALPLGIVAVPTVRGPDGLALSSRNRYLSAEERAHAPVFAATLRELAAKLADGSPAAPLIAPARAALAEAGFAVDYLELVEATTLRPLEAAAAPARLIAAARLGAVRLLDNFAVQGH